MAYMIVGGTAESAQPMRLCDAALTAGLSTDGTFRQRSSRSKQGSACFCFSDETDGEAKAARLAKEASDKEQERAKQMAQDLQTLADYTGSSGLWVDALVLAATDLKNGREVEIARFNDSIAELRQRVRRLRTMPTPDAVAVQTADVHALFTVNTTAREALLTGNSEQLGEAITDFRKCRQSITGKLKAEISAKWNVTLTSH